MTAPDRDRLREVIAKATPGPRRVENRVVLTTDDDVRTLLADYLNGDLAECRANAEFAATFDPPTVAALLDELDENERVIKALRRQRDEAEAERDVLRERLERVEALADEWQHTFFDPQAKALRAALLGGEAGEGA